MEDGVGPMLFLRDKATNPRISAQTSESGTSLALHEANSERHLSLKVLPSGTSALFIGEIGPNPESPTVGPSLKLAVDNGGPCLLLGRDNKVFWSAP